MALPTSRASLKDYCLRRLGFPVQTIDITPEQADDRIDDRTPYTYFLHHKPTDTFYYGVRYGKNCHPDDFWKKYFTSSKDVALLRTLFGDDSFEFQIRKIFNSIPKARDWEYKVIKRMKILQKQNKWLNKRNGKCIIYTDEVKLKMKRVKAEYIKKIGKNHPMYGRKRPKLSAYNKLESTSKKRRGSGNGMFGKKRPDLTERNKQLKMWITNGIQNKLVKRDFIIFDGWKRGRVLRGVV